MLALLLSAVQAGVAEAGKIEFLVAERPGTIDPHGDSYVVAIDESQTALLEHARALVDWAAAGAVTDPPGDGPIVVAEIAAGGDGRNRDYLAPGEPLWSWHIVGPPSFGDITAEILDGWPTFVEQDVAGWIANTNGFVGFWNYTVVAELGPVVPEPSAAMLLIAGALLVAARPGKIAARNGTPPR
jgi:hypothetical protein